MTISAADNLVHRDISSTRIHSTVELGDYGATIATTTVSHHESGELVRVHALTSLDDETIIVLVDTVNTNRNVRININDGTVFETQPRKPG